jgi:phage shock protein A
MPRHLLLSLLLLAITGCGDPRLEIARDQILAKVDSLLGEIQVMRRGIDPAIRQAEAAVAQLTKGRIEVQVCLCKISADLSAAQASLEETDRGLVRLRNLLNQDEPVEIAGHTCSPSELRSMANRAISARKRLATQAETLQATHDRLEVVVVLLQAREQQGRDRLDGLKQLLSEIDAKAAALEAVKDAARLCEEVGPLDFEDLEMQIRDLEAEIDGKLAYHQEMLRQVTLDSDSLQEILRSTATANELAAEIDRVLKPR